MNRKEVGKVVLFWAISLLGGFLMLFVTYGSIGEKALRLPGGALCFGFAMGFVVYQGGRRLATGLVCVAAALAGHFLAVAVA